ncbi:glycogen debranching protein GlgX [Nanchangia anserum]|uniref:Glycogen debranching protein GlgX n=1 Tax=Nanchangia anserum TaxID=2692125 RepID=A0A8I0G8K8_9ACTO|nr:glycogen debranching protein GlgX [Nanchangia anserum]MBD3689910.1 glycogen debranching protein GlgX [Nanchangia anserum]QOX82273.1 glycogen debranching protein GlgX [Nanchangia anserum]
MPETFSAYESGPVSPRVPRGATNPSRLGGHIVADGVDIAVVAPHAKAVEVCFFDSYAADAEETRFQLIGPDEGVWHGHVAGYHTGTPYGFRVWGPWDPQRGLVYNPNKLALDPYARAITGAVDLTDAVYAHRCDDDLYPIHPLQPDSHDSASHTVRGVIQAPSFPVVAGPRTPWNDTIIYEAHVKGLTKNLPDVPEHLRGTYAGLAHPATVSYLTDLGVTAIELLPVHAKLDEPFLTERGLSNYWGYSTLSYFAPEPSYASAAARAGGPSAVLDEFRGMVSLLHEAGLELILDVVYNHTCEGGMSGPGVSWRLIDNAMYYRIDPATGHTRDFTGCGNSLDSSEPRVNEMILDSLRYWARDMGVDGFRFDLGVTNGRLHEDFSPDHPLLQACLLDPVLRQKKMIAEPWDVGIGGWQTGGFPQAFSTWNDHYRDSLRQFWLVDAGTQSRGIARGGGPYDLATRLSGSQDLYGHLADATTAATRRSINFVTAHDGFTMADLTCYERKHNGANLEENRDGTNNNLSWNHGVEGRAAGPYLTKDDVPQAIEMLTELRPLRSRSLRNLFTMLMISAGTPMFVAGDEFGRTQFGNNNAYCQDSEISWVDWDLEDFQHDLHDCARMLIHLRRNHPVLRPARFLTGQAIDDVLPDVSWYTRAGTELSDHSWHDPENRVLQMLRSGKPHGDVDLLAIINATAQETEVRLAEGRGTAYTLRWDTTWERPEDPDELTRYVGGQKILMEPLSIALLLSSPDVKSLLEH